MHKTFFDLKGMFKKSSIESFFVSMDYFKKYSLSFNPYFLNEIAWEAYDKSEDLEILKKAFYWSSVSLKKDRCLNNLDTYLKLAKKLGKNEFVLEQKKRLRKRKRYSYNIRIV